MITINIKYDRQVTFLGRNGLFNQSGISVTAFGLAPVPRTITLEPITSKGLIGQAAIEIPLENLPQVISELYNHLSPEQKQALAIEK